MLQLCWKLVAFCCCSDWKVVSWLCEARKGSWGGAHNDFLVSMDIIMTERWRDMRVRTRKLDLLTVKKILLLRCLRTIECWVHCTYGELLNVSWLWLLVLRMPASGMTVDSLRPSFLFMKEACLFILTHINRRMGHSGLYSHPASVHLPSKIYSQFVSVWSLFIQGW